MKPEHPTNIWSVQKGPKSAWGCLHQAAFDQEYCDMTKLPGALFAYQICKTDIANISPTLSTVTDFSKTIIKKHHFSCKMRSKISDNLFLATGLMEQQYTPSSIHNIRVLQLFLLFYNFFR